MTPLATIGVIVGMRSEARLLAPGAMVGCSGGAQDKAAQLVDYMLRAGVDGVISFGISGGLAPGLAPGTIVIGSAVDLGGASLPADHAWCQRLSNSLRQAQMGVVCGATEPCLTPADKAALHLESGGLAVDLESGAVAEACAGAGKPFAVLRAIADPASRAIPDFALKGLGPDGTTRSLPVILGLLRRPLALPSLLALARDSNDALRSLGAAARLLGPTLGF